MNRKQKKMLLRILSAAAATGILLCLPLTGLPKLMCYLAVYGLIGYDILRKAVLGICNGRVLDENFLMAIATVGAFALALWSKSEDYLEAIAVMLFYQTGEFFQSYAVGKSRKSIAKLMDIRPEYANLEQGGTLSQVDPGEVDIGSVIQVQPGERIPLDGIVIEGSSTLDTAALTGESIPREVRPGDSVISGCINLQGLLRIQTQKEFGESTVSRILDLVENATSRKSRSENFISRFARVYTPAVCIGALTLAAVPPLAALALGMAPVWQQWVYRALTFLVISCPCALVISVPLSFFASIGGASYQGILVKGSNYLEALAKVECVVFDKTGTLTQGTFYVQEIYGETMPEKTLIELAAHAECASSHPISQSLRRAYGGEVDRSRVCQITEHSGYGVEALVDGRRVAAGNDRLMDRLGIPVKKNPAPGTLVHIAVDGDYAGSILIADQLKENAPQAIRSLKISGVRRILMLTGDREAAAARIAAQLGIGEYRSELLPEDKVGIVESLLEKDVSVAFVGDGINDAPVLARANVGIAMGAMGSDAAIEAADVVLMDDDPMQIAKAITLARKCMGIVRQNIVFSLGVKFACLALGAIGIANLWTAIFADVGVMVLAVLNATRGLRKTK